MSNSSDLSINALLRARLIASFPGLSATLTELGFPDFAPVKLVDAGVAQDAVFVAGRFYHTIQVHGMDTSEPAWAVSASLDGTDYDTLLGSLASDGFHTLTSGAYGFLKATGGGSPAGITIQYVGAGSASVIVIDSGVLTTTCTGATADNLSITLATAGSLNDLAATIAASHGGTKYTCVVDSIFGDDPATVLNPVGSTGIKTSPLVISRVSTNSKILLGSMR
jgi:hypothetical protein